MSHRFSCFVHTDKQNYQVGDDVRVICTLLNIFSRAPLALGSLGASKIIVEVRDSSGKSVQTEKWNFADVMSLNPSITQSKGVLSFLVNLSNDMKGGEYCLCVSMECNHYFTRKSNFFGKSSEVFYHFPKKVEMVISSKGFRCSETKSELILVKEKGEPTWDSFAIIKSKRKTKTEVFGIRAMNNYSLGDCSGLVIGFGGANEVKECKKSPREVVMKLVSTITSTKMLDTTDSEMKIPGKGYLEEKADYEFVIDYSRDLFLVYKNGKYYGKGTKKPSAFSSPLCLIILPYYGRTEVRLLGSPSRDSYFSVGKRKITVSSRRIGGKKFKMDLTFIREGFSPGDEVGAILSVSNIDNSFLDKPKIVCSARVDGKEFFKKSYEDSCREGELVIFFKLPEKMKDGKGMLHCSVSSGFSESISKTIPIVVKRIDCRIYPEGGNVVANLVNGIYFEARHKNGKPLDFRGALQEDGNDVCLVETVHEGRGCFEYLFKKGISYEIRVIHPHGICSIPFVPVDEDGISLRFKEKRRLKFKEGVKVILSSNQKRKIKIGLFKKDSCIVEKDLDISAKETEVTLDSGKYSGVLRITVFSQGIPICERLVYISPEDRITFQIEANKEFYLPREEVQLSIRTFSEKTKKPIDTSVQCVVVNDSVDKMTEKRMRHPTLFESCFLQNEVQEFYDSSEYFKEHASYVDFLLGVQGWRRFIYYEKQYKGEFVGKMTSEEVSSLLCPLKKSQDLPAIRKPFSSNRAWDEILYVEYMNSETKWSFFSQIGKIFKKQSPSEELAKTKRTYCGEAKRLIREIEREIRSLKQLEKKVLRELRGFAKNNLVSDAKLMANDIVLHRRVVLDFTKLKYVVMSVVLRVKKAEKVMNVNRLIWSLVRMAHHLFDRRLGQFKLKFRPLIKKLSTLSSYGSMKYDSMSDSMDDFDDEEEQESLRADVDELLCSVVDASASTAESLGRSNSKQSSFGEEDELSRRFAALQGDSSVVSSTPIVTQSTKSTTNVVLKKKTSNGLLGTIDINPLSLEERLNRLKSGGTVSQRKNVSICFTREYAHRVRKSDVDLKRNDFTETLLFHPCKKTEKGETKVKFHLNDGVSSFLVKLDSFTEMGIIGSERKFQIITKEDLFIDFKLPQEVSFKDRVKFSVVVCNNHASDRIVNLKVMDFNERVFLFAKKEVERKVKGNSRTKAYFEFKLKAVKVESFQELNSIAVQLVEGKRVVDEVVRKIKLKAFGFPQYLYRNFSIPAGESEVFDIVIPKDYVENSIESICYLPTKVTTLSNSIKALVKNPTGCCEQTINSLLPTALAMEYLLNNQGKVEKWFMKCLQKYLKEGLSKILNYEVKGKSGKREGFSWWGKTPIHLALSALVLKQLVVLSRVFQVDRNVIFRTKEYILSQMNEDKSGFVQKAHYGFGKLASGHLRNCYVLWCLSETGMVAYNQVREIGENSFKKLTNAKKDNYDCYVLSLLGISLFNFGEKEKALDIAKVISKFQEDNGSLSQAEMTITNSLNINKRLEVTALACILFAKVGMMKEMGRGASFIKKRATFGRFGSTQSNSLCLELLIRQLKENKVRGTSTVTLETNAVVQELKLTPDKCKMKDRSFKPFLGGIGENQIKVCNNSNEPIDFSLSIAYRRETFQQLEKYPLQFSCKMMNANLEEGDSTEIEISLENLEKEIQDSMILIFVNLPGAFEVDLEKVKELVKENDEIQFFEQLSSRSIVFYLMGLKKLGKVVFRLPVSAEIKGTFVGDPSYIQFYYDNRKFYYKPLTACIN